MSICLYASDLALALGLNRFQSRSDLILKLWQKEFPKDYDNTLKIISQKEKVIVRPKENEIDCIKRIAKTGKMNIHTQVNDCLNTQDTSSLLRKRQKLLKDINQTPDLNQVQKKEIKDSLLSLTNKNFGTNQEFTAVQQYMAETGRIVTKTDQFVRKKIFEIGNTKWYLGGKIDGITNDKIVIEVKNRIYKHFNEIRVYERPQLQAYLHILGLTKGHLVESIKTTRGPVINILEDNYDPTYWNQTILENLKKFAILFDQFKVDINFKTVLLIGSEKEKDQFLDRMLNALN